MGMGITGIPWVPWDTEMVMNGNGMGIGINVMGTELAFYNDIPIPTTYFQFSVFKALKTVSRR